MGVDAGVGYTGIDVRLDQADQRGVAQGGGTGHCYFQLAAGGQHIGRPAGMQAGSFERLTDIIQYAQQGVAVSCSANIIGCTKRSCNASCRCIDNRKGLQTGD